MTTKSALKEAEWDLLKTSPQWVEAMLTSYRAGGGGLVGKRYQHILNKVLSDYKTNNPLIKEVLAFNEDPKIDGSTTQDQAKKQLERIGLLLEKQVDPPDAKAFRQFLLDVGQKFAEETSEGLFGLGSDVSKKEMEILESVKVALKATGADEQRRAKSARDDAETKAKAKAEAEAKAKAAEEARKKQEAEAKAKAEAEAKAKAAEEARKKQEAEAKTKAEAEAKAKAAKAAEEARKKQEAEAKTKAEAEAKAKAAEEARKKQEAEAKTKAEAKAKAAEEAKAAQSIPKAEQAKVKQKPAAAPPAAQPATAQQKTESATRTYEVKSGDSLSKIALELYGNAGRWPEIFEANKDQIKNPNLIHPGQKLRIP